MAPRNDDDPAAGVSPPLTFDQRRQVVADLSRYCGPERWAHLALSVITAGGLLFLAYTILANEPHWTTAVTMFGATGIIAASQGRILHLWTQFARILMGDWK